jgi:hypothetical protein
MDSLETISKSNKWNYFKQVFAWNNDVKGELCDIAQYTLLAIIPMVILVKLLEYNTPLPDEDKGSLTLTAEILGELLFIFIYLFLMNRLIVHIPTYSGQKYPSGTMLFIILPIMLISIQSPLLREKINILINRLSNMWNGNKNSNTNTKQNKNKQKYNKYSNQQGSNNQQSYNTQMQQSPVNNSAQDAYNASLNSVGTTSISSLPPITSSSPPTQTYPDYNNMYQHQTTHLVDAATPGLENFEPVAANDSVGSAFGTSVNW